jgi:RNA polymerase sigma-70 factor (ECF subfamily)
VDDITMSMSASQEQELIARAQAGDREAFCLLAEGYERRIYALALHFTRHPQDAEDLSQEVWLKAYRAISTFRGEAGFYTWLRRIAVNTLLNERRGKALKWDADKKAIRMGELVSLDELGLTIAEPAQAVEDALHQKLMADQVMQALNDLRPRERMIFLLKHREGMTYEEISRACNTSVGTIRKALFRTVSKLRQHLGIASEAAEIAPVVVGEKS